MGSILQEKSIEARALTLEQLGYEVGLEYKRKTVKNVIGSIYYQKCIACKKSWVNKKTAPDRKA